MVLSISIQLPWPDLLLKISPNIATNPWDHLIEIKLISMKSLVSKKDNGGVKYKVK